jgi:hypothetical protein
MYDDETRTLDDHVDVSVGGVGYTFACANQQHFEQ